MEIKLNTDKKVIVALDFDNQTEALRFVKQLQPSECRLKVGKEMFTYFGPEFVQQLVDDGFDVFLDLKFHDIPNTVAKACVAAAKLGVWMVNVHASGGTKMMKAAVDALEPFGDSRPKLIAVTVLTSMSEDDLREQGINMSPQERVLELAKLTKAAGFDGVVCSAQEASTLRQALGEDFVLVTPGIRPEGSEVGDQKRIMTPVAALKAGVDYMVIGRPITQSSRPLDTLKSINQSLVV